MDNSLTVVDAQVLTPEEQNQLDVQIDRIISSHRNNRQEINRLVFECTAALTEAEDDSRRLASKGWFKSLVGGLTGSNRKLQNKINTNLRAAQYASQVTLQKLAEQNLMTFDLITAVNNKLNASVQYMNEQFKNQYTVIGKFFLKNRSDIVSLELRMANVERNVDLLTWQSSIEYLQLNGKEYSSLDNTGKIVCIVRDFYDLTKGDWTTKDLLLLKSAMGNIGISPHEKMNYLQTVETIADTPEFKEKLLGGAEILPVEDPSYLITMGTLGKMNALDSRDHYLVSVVRKKLADHGIAEGEKEIRNDVTSEYMKQEASVDLNTTVEAYDLVLDFLYNLNQAEKEGILVLSDEELRQSFLQNPEKAFSIIREYADKGNGMALYLMGAYYENGYNAVDCRREKAIEYYRKALQAGYAPAAIECCSYESDEERKNDLLNQWAEKNSALAQEGDCLAEEDLGYMYHYGRGVEQSYEKAVEWYRKAADQGYARAQHNLGYMYYSGHGVEQSYEKAVEWYRKAADQGLAAAQNNLGYMYYCGHGVEQSYEKAVEWYRKAADQGLAAAQSDLGYMYYNGQGVEQSYEKAVEWDRKAVDQGYAVAQYDLGYMYYSGHGVEQSYEKAVEWYRKAADQGNADAQNRLGNMYYNCQGVEQSYEKAVEWYRKAADQGNATAQYSLGIMYYIGQGVEQSNEKAVEWYRKAADQGNARAQCKLGFMYEYGQGVGRSYEKAVEWYRKAADQGDARAKMNLSELGAD